MKEPHEWEVKVQFKAGFTKTVRDNSLAGAILSVTRMVWQRAAETEPTGIEVTPPSDRSIHAEG